MRDGTKNLKPVQSKEEAKERGRKGGLASGEARRRKRDLKQRMKALMEMDADPRLAAALSATGVDVNDNLDVIIASIMKGALKGDPRLIDKALELSGKAPDAAQKKAIAKANRRKAEAEAERAEMENELYRMRLNAIKGIDQEETPDDGFLEALSGTAGEDWSDEVI